MRIAQVVVTYPPYRGGIGNVASAYASGLRTRGHEVAVWTPSYPALPPPDPGVVRLRPWLRVGQLALLPQLAWRGGDAADVVHLHAPFFGAALFVSLRRALRRRPPLVVTYHMDARAGGLRGLVFAAHRRLLQPWQLRRADRILVNSLDYMRASALGRVPGIASRVEEHPFGVDTERFRPGAEPELRRRHGLGSLPTILFVGGLDAAHHFKGLPVLLRALAELGSEARLLVVGDGALRRRYERQAAALGVAARVRFVGAVDDDLLPRYYRAADLHVLPSTSGAEAFGLVLLEAAASGIPAVASDLPGVRIVVRDGETGMLTAPGEPAPLAAALDRLVADVELRRRLGVAARQRAVAERTWDRAVDRLTATYEAVLGQIRPARRPRRG